MKTTETKETKELVKGYYAKHKSAILAGFRDLATLSKAYEEYKKKVLMEEALDYASK